MLGLSGQGVGSGADGYTPNFGRVGDEGAHELASGQFPYLDRLILASTDQGLSIRADGYTENYAFMDRLILASTDLGPSIGADGYTPNFFSLVVEGAHDLASGHFPYLVFLIHPFT